MVSRQHPARCGWISHRNFVSLVGNPCRLINVCCVVILMTVSLKGVIGMHVGDFLISLADGMFGEKWMYEIKSLYRWGSWKVSESEFAGVWVRQHRDFSIAIDLEDYTNKFITEATRERSRQRQESLTAQELSMLRGVLGADSWRAQQMSPQFAADVGLLLSATADPVVQDLLDANKLFRDMSRSSAQSLHFHSFNDNETPWQQLVFASWADASDRPRPDAKIAIVLKGAKMRLIHDLRRNGTNARVTCAPSHERSCRWHYGFAPGQNTRRRGGSTHIGFP